MIFSFCYYRCCYLNKNLDDIYRNNWVSKPYEYWPLLEDVYVCIGLPMSCPRVHLLIATYVRAYITGREFLLARSGAARSYAVHRLAFLSSDARVVTPLRMKVLNVAEKNDAAKSIANVMSRGSSQRVSQLAVSSTYISLPALFPVAFLRSVPARVHWFVERRIFAVQQDLPVWLHVYKIYQFDYMFQGQQVTMVMTSVSGHLQDVEFGGQYKSWYVITLSSALCMSVRFHMINRTWYILYNIYYIIYII